MNREIPLDLPLAIAPRSPDTVMRLSRMGSAHPMRLSFLRVLLRRVRTEDWRFDRPLWRVDDRGVGVAVYRARGPERTYSLVAFAHDLPDDMRSDRVIATAWDATFALVDGEPTEDDLQRLAANVPLQEAGRISGRELSLSRANRSVRLFSHVVDRLAEGRQPDAAEIDAVGYLMRTTAVYGSGKFGAADRDEICDRPELKAPFQAEMLSVWLTRAFTVDIAEHLARVRSGATAVRLDPALRRRLGVGNSTGLGMAPFLVRHPALLNAWMTARETALARVRSLSKAGPDTLAGFASALAAARDNAALWHSNHPAQIRKLADLRTDLAQLQGWTETGWRHDAPLPWNALWLWGEANLTEEGQESLLALLLEPHGALVDDLADRLDADEATGFAIDPRMTLGRLKALIAAGYPWVSALDLADPAQSARFWYVSEEKLEPRLGDRRAEAGQEREQPLGIAQAVAALSAALAGRDEAEGLAGFLLAHPEHRHTIRRVQTLHGLPYAEIRDNLLAPDMLPIDILRCKLAFFGATHFDPRSDRWVRISLFKGLPFPDEVSA
ncbi:hypothetical protein [Tabrizicola oligotrophica]|uniref:Uncharacterized protein n=1 Tax=Tabrizicola oligotrophica TaxID=2710650 RepID=A0A6M0QY15_9RHOB|nr:hypothetical protein [Tabrizicola oligotrophica]NEY91332.1 hypothetical protein [Tabrizicola oligotrophica]